MSELLMLKGAVGLAPDDGGWKIDQAADSSKVFESQEIVAEMEFYEHAEDVVHGVKIRGIVGERTVSEPSIEDRRYVSTQMIMKILYESGLDVHDFKQMIGWIIGAEPMPDFQSGEESQLEDNWRLYLGLSKIYHDLGGME